MLLGGFQCLWTGFVSTRKQMLPREVRRLQGDCVAFRAKERGVVSSMLLGGFQCLWTGFVSTKNQMLPREVRRLQGVCVAFRAKKRGVDSLMLLGGSQCLRTGLVSTKKQMRPREVRRLRGVGAALRAKERGRCRFVNVTGRFPMSSDWVREHKETNASKGGALMAWCLCCLKSEIKR
jgi:hypothetical protein